MIDAKEEFCFSEVNTEEAIVKPKQVFVNVTRSSPACGTASISLNLTFTSSGITLCKLYSCTCIQEFTYKS